jgi:hypothetical protein
VSGRGVRHAGRGLLLVLALVGGCGPGAQPPTYEDDQGVRFVPPPGWVERARADAGLGGTAAGHGRNTGQPDLPLPPLAVRGAPAPGRLLVRYDRLTPGRLAWLRVAAADMQATAAPAACLAPPGPGWRREAEVESLELGGSPAARAAFRGRWENQEYLNETVAVARPGRVYLLSASFPAADAAAREQVRQAVAGAVWR